MIKRHAVAGILACGAFLLYELGCVDSQAAMQVQPLQSEKAYRQPSSDNLRVVLLGTASGPSVALDQFGMSTLVEAGSTRLLFDCGRATTIRLTQAGIPIASVNRLFLTHLHSDHIIQIPDLFLVGWSSGRTVPLEVWGPDGTHDMMDALQRAYAFDIRVRRAVNEYPVEGVKVISSDIKEGPIFDREDLKVTLGRCRRHLATGLITAVILSFYQAIPAYQRIWFGTQSVRMCLFMKCSTLLLHSRALATWPGRRR